MLFTFMAHIDDARCSALTQRVVSVIQLSKSIISHD